MATPKWDGKWDVFAIGHLISSAGSIGLSAVYRDNRAIRDDDEDQPPTWVVYARTAHYFSVKKDIHGDYEVEISKTIPAKPEDASCRDNVPPSREQINEAARDLIAAISKMTRSLPPAPKYRQADDDGGYY